MLEYPRQLPPPQRSGYAFSPVSPLQVSPDRVNGPRRRRRRFVSTPTYCAVTFRFSTSEQAALFEGWLEHALASASQPFMCPLKHPVTFGGDDGLEYFEVRLDDWPEGPVLVESGRDAWDYTATIELRKRPMMSEAWVLDQLVGYDGGLVALNDEALRIWLRWNTDAWRTDP